MFHNPIYTKEVSPPCINAGFTNLQRIALGLVLSTIGMAVSALVEKKRLGVAKSEGRHNTTLTMSVFYLIPQFFLVGSGEAFMYTGQLDFFLTKSPKSMKTMSTGLFLTTLSLGFFVSSFLVAVVKKVTGSSHSGQDWLADNINYGRLDLFYALLAVLGVINFVVYLICSIWFKPRKNKSAVEMERVMNGNDEENC